MPKQKKYFKSKVFLAGLRDLLDALPTKAEKEDIQSNFGALLEFLTTLQENLRALPSSEDTRDVKNAIQTLENLILKAETNPILAEMIGIRRPTSAKRAKTSMSEDEIAKAKTVRTNLESLPVDEIRSKLKYHSLQELKALASVMGIKSTERLSRDALTHQITTKIANYRGYQALRGQPEQNTTS